MSLQVGIVGLPNVGKSTLFQALTKKQVDTSNYPFATIDPNVGVVAVPDDRLEPLAKLSASQEIIPTTIEFVDIAGLVKGASQGEGLGNKFLSNIREVDAICHVVRGFEDANVHHVSGRVNPDEDEQTILYELAMADLDQVTKALDTQNGKARSGDKEAKLQVGILERINAALNEGKPANTVDLSKEEKEAIRYLNLLTMKPILTLYNVSEDEVSEATTPLKVCVKMEAELAELPSEDAKAMLQELGWKSSGLDRLIRASYELLNLITMLTTGPKETRAWTVKQGSPAPQAAGVIHTDFIKAFIRAEVINWKTLLEAGSEANAKAKGLMRMEGKEYIIQDGDVVHFHISQ
ncbi:MAG: redox-regulated ATPase YchF [Candidatus Nomurabacteria bacterium]|nr:MAG: redox-regulated ATPase YchF [Candidatus Nomurabacteria bacterium]